MSEKIDRSAKETDGTNLKHYAKPTLTKGPLLGSATAAAPASTLTDASDIRLKRDIHPIGLSPDGLTLYRFRYLWSEVEMVGVMAQEVLEVAPEAVILAADGFYRVDYARLGLRCTTYAAWRAETELADAA